MKLKRTFLFLALNMPLLLFGQQNPGEHKVTGVVTRGGNQPVQGVSIYVDGQKTSTVTDSLGAFTVYVKDDAKKIQVNSDSLGYGKVKIKGDDRVLIN